MEFLHHDSGNHGLEFLFHGRPRCFFWMLEASSFFEGDGFDYRASSSSSSSSWDGARGSMGPE
jgi:hypothetical protein